MQADWKKKDTIQIYSSTPKMLLVFVYVNQSDGFNGLQVRVLPNILLLFKVIHTQTHMCWNMVLILFILSIIQTTSILKKLKHACYSFFWGKKTLRNQKKTETGNFGWFLLGQGDFEHPQLSWLCWQSSASPLRWGRFGWLDVSPPTGYVPGNSAIVTFFGMVSLRDLLERWIVTFNVWG